MVFQLKHVYPPFLFGNKKSRHQTFTLDGGPTKFNLQKPADSWTHVFNIQF